MNNNYNQDSWTKGEQFENFVEKVIFPEEHYELIDKTSDSKQNKRRYVKNSRNPDFQFKCRLSGRLFYVEAKFRSKTFKDSYDVLSEDQFKSFPSLNSKECPIFVVFGYGGNAENPEFVSFIPLRFIDTIRLSPSKVQHYNIEKSAFLNSDLNFEDLNGDTNKNQEFQKESLAKSGKEQPKTLLERTNSKILGLAAIGILALFISIYSFAFSTSYPVTPPKEELKLIVDNYYKTMNSNQVEKLPDFLSAKITSWYGAKNPTQEEILRNAKAHRGKYPFSTSDINWNSFTVIKEDNGDYHVSYEMIYKSKEKITDDYKVYDLKLITKWDENLKLKSITEVRL